MLVYGNALKVGVSLIYLAFFFKILPEIRLVLESLVASSNFLNETELRWFLDYSSD
jgi:hypothetical protein